jgi:DnaJ family protein C protein 16
MELDELEMIPDVEAGNLIHSVETLTPEEETLSSIVFEEHLLDGLSNWLDRLFDGTTQKYHIQYWPDHMK